MVSDGGAVSNLRIPWRYRSFGMVRGGAGAERQGEGSPRNPLFGVGGARVGRPTGAPSPDVGARAGGAPRDAASPVRRCPRWRATNVMPCVDPPRFRILAFARSRRAATLNAHGSGSPRDRPPCGLYLSVPNRTHGIVNPRRWSSLRRGEGRDRRAASPPSNRVRANGRPDDPQHGSAPAARRRQATPVGSGAVGLRTRVGGGSSVRARGAERRSAFRARPEGPSGWPTVDS